jgi:hypothetical protein
MAYNNDAEADEIVRREAAKRGISETMYRMLRVADTSLVQDLVNDLRGGPPQRSSIIPQNNRSGPAEPGSGWRDAKPLTTPPGIEHVDRMVEVQTARERLQAVREAIEADEALKRARDKQKE